MKKSLIFGTILLGIGFQAHAQRVTIQIVQPLLTYTKSKGPVSPAYRETRICQVANDGMVYFEVRTGKTAENKSKKPIRWTGIRNEAVLNSLIQEASKGLVVVPKHRLPVGGPIEVFEAYTDGSNGREPVMLKRIQSSKLAKVNTSESAARLVKFLEVNCGIQK